MPRVFLPSGVDRSSFFVRCVVVFPSDHDDCGLEGVVALPELPDNAAEVVVLQGVVVILPVQVRLETAESRIKGK